MKKAKTQIMLNEAKMDLQHKQEREEMLRLMTEEAEIDDKQLETPTELMLSEHTLGSLPDYFAGEIASNLMVLAKGSV